MFDDFWESYKAPGDEASSRNPFETIMRALGHSTPRNFEETQPQVAAHGSQSVKHLLLHGLVVGNTEWQTYRATASNSNVGPWGTL